MKHAFAALLCIALLAVMVGFFGLFAIGAYQDFALGEPIDPQAFLEMFSPRYYRILLIAGVVAAGFALLDIHALTTEARSGHGQSFEDTPYTEPIGFAAVRFRRYLLPVLSMAWLAVAYRLMELSFASFLIPYSGYLYLFGFFVARRPLRFSVKDALDYVSGRYVEPFLKSYSESR